MSPSPALVSSDAPFKPAVARAAALWFVQLTAEDVSEADRRALEKWRAADPEHERAWQRTQQLGHQFSSITPGTGMAALDRPSSSKRRQTIKHLSLLLIVGTTGVATYKSDYFPNGDFHTATGERQTITLADGSTLIMNTHSAVDILFTPEARLITLRHGEIFIATAKEDGPYRPLRVQTSQGMLTALGTRFSVRQLDNTSRLAVEEGAVEIRPLTAPNAPRIIKAGQIADFDRTHILGSATLDESQLAWRSGVLIADRMRLGDFVAELSRYRRGVLRCDPAIAELEISGSFPLANTDRILQSLVDTLPVKVSMVTRYWVQIGSA